MVNLGDEVKDIVSGFQGIAWARHIYLQGCDRISVQPPVDKEGKLPDASSFDEPQLRVTMEGKVKPEVVSEPDDPGGPDKYPDKRRG